MRIITVDSNRMIYFSFNTDAQESAEMFMTRLGYGSLDYYLDLDEPKTILKLSNRGFTEVEVVVLRTNNDEGSIDWFLIA